MRHGRRSTTNAGLLAGALSTPACTSAGEPSGAVPSGAAPSTEERSSTALTIPQIVDAVQPSVVTVLTDGGSGGGVLYDDDETVITNEHVVRGRRQVRLSFADGAQRGSSRTRRRGPGSRPEPVRPDP